MRCAFGSFGRRRMDHAEITMPDSCLLIDDAGRKRRWPDEGGGLGFGYRDPDFDFPAYAVRNLGYVMIVGGAAFMRIRLRPAFVGHRTLATLLAHVAHHPYSRTAISHFDGAWHHALCGDARALRRRLLDVVETTEDSSPERPFIAVRRAIAGVLREPNDPFAPVLRRWLDDSHPDGLANFLDSCRLFDRAMIVERQPDTGHFVFKHSGHRIRLYKPSWAGNAIGRLVQDQPDRVYGEWIAEACRAVDDRQVPRYELVTARVSHSAETPRQWRYERLMLPWRGSDGRRLVVSVSLRDQPRWRHG
jgi:hypothetical protein